MQKMAHEQGGVPRTFRSLALFVTILLFTLMVAGGVIRVFDAGGTCPDWPTCFGQWLPPSNSPAALDYWHRFAALLAAPLSAVLAWMGWKYARADRWVLTPAVGLFGLLLVQSIWGAGMALQPEGGGAEWLSAVHLGLSLLILAAAAQLTVSAYFRPLVPLQQQSTALAVISAPSKPVYRSSFARWSLATLGIVFILLLSGALVAGSQATGACTTWPLCSGTLLPGSWKAWINSLHHLVVAAAGLALGVLFVQAWRTQKTRIAVLVSTTAATVLFFAQALLGSQLVQGFPVYLLPLHQATAVAVWVALVVQVTAVGLEAGVQEDSRFTGLNGSTWRGYVKDLLVLTKPVVVALLLVTTFAGMVIGAQSWPSLSVVFWTLLGGFMAAGGSGAINQYIDRFDDGLMQRTQKRPIPAGRLTAGEGLAFGVGIALASFYLLVAFVNLLAALLSLAGIIYYVLLYSIFLKKTTVQNIVIGGGAGAIPPLVGWAAATGELNVPSLFLFAVVFMWTPPHFWALSIVRRNDYARAGVPMLPVIRGEQETRWRIFVYTIELVVLTLVLPIFGLGGGIYLIGAGVLGLWLLAAAYRVWRQSGNKVAWKMYRYSSMYLAGLFLILMIDRLL